MLQVSNNGYFSVGTLPQYNFSTFPGTSSYSVIAPFAADIDTSSPGRVRYTQFTTTDPQMSTVSSFIQKETGETFSGVRMMIAEWHEVSLSLSPTVRLYSYN